MRQDHDTQYAIYRARRDAAHERERQRRARNRRAMWAVLGWLVLACLAWSLFVLAAAILH